VRQRFTLPGGGLIRSGIQADEMLSIGAVLLGTWGSEVGTVAARLI
jgi:hypothetical protein